MPPRNERLVEGHVPVITDSAETCIDATDSPDLLADSVRVERTGKMNVVRPGSQFRVKFFKDLAPHETLEAQWVVDGQRPALPVKEFIHLKGVRLLPANAVSITYFDKLKILGDRTHWQDPARWLPPLVIRANLISH